MVHLSVSPSCRAKETPLSEVDKCQPNAVVVPPQHKPAQALATLLVLHPQVYLPLKPNFATKFDLLSRVFSGSIVTLSSERHWGDRIGRFKLYTGKLSRSCRFTLWRVAKRIFVHTLYPIMQLLVTQRKPDAIVVYDPYGSGLAGVALKLLLRSKLIVEVNGDFHLVEPSSSRIKRTVMRTVLRVCLKYADGIKVLNKSQECYCRSVFPGKVVSRFHNVIAEDYFRQVETYTGDYLLFVGYPFDLKGVDVLLRAFALIADRHPQAKLRIMGHCRSDKELAHYKALAGNSGRVGFIKPGWIEDVAEQIRGCYALVNAARTEALGRVHLEAMFCGKPIIASDTNGAKECVVDGETGLLCRIDDVEDLAQKLSYLLSNPSEARKMGSAGLERARRQFSGDNYLRSYVNLVESVLGREEPGAKGPCS